MTRIYVAPRTGDGESTATSFRPAIPEGTIGAFYPRDDQFLVLTYADLTGIPGVTELTGDAIDRACAAWEIDRAVLGEGAP